MNSYTGEILIEKTNIFSHFFINTLNKCVISIMILFFFVTFVAEIKKMLKQIVVDKVLARQLRGLGFHEPSLAFYNCEDELLNADGEEPVLKDFNAPKQTRGRGARCYSAPTLSAVQDWLRRKKHLELLICRDTFFQNTGDYYCRLIRLSDGLSRDTKPRKLYDQALMDGIRQAISLLSK